MSYTSDYAPVEPTRADIDAMAGAVLVEFGAPWCGHCIGLQPALQDLLGQFREVTHIKIYDGRGKPLGRSFRVKLWPNLVFMRDGVVAQQLARPDSASVLRGLTTIAAG